MAPVIVSPVSLANSLANLQVFSVFDVEAHRTPLRVESVRRFYPTTWVGVLHT